MTEILQKRLGVPKPLFRLQRGLQAKVISGESACKTVKKISEILQFLWFEERKTLAKRSRERYNQSDHIASYAAEKMKDKIKKL